MNGKRQAFPTILSIGIMCPIGLIFYLYLSGPIVLTHYERILCDFEERKAPLKTLPKLIRYLISINFHFARDFARGNPTRPNEIQSSGRSN